MTDFLVGIGVLLVIEGLLLAGFTRWTRSAMASVITAPDTLLRPRRNMLRGRRPGRHLVAARLGSPI